MEYKQELEYQLRVNTKLSNELLLSSAFSLICSISWVFYQHINLFEMILTIAFFKLGLYWVETTKVERRVLEQLKNNRLVSRIAYIMCILNILLWAFIIFVYYVLLGYNHN